MCLGQDCLCQSCAFFADCPTTETNPDDCGISINYGFYCGFPVLYCEKFEKEGLIMNYLAQKINKICEIKGFNKDFEINRALLLCHSELSEAVEQLRAGHEVKKVYIENGKPEGFPVELADCIIRILHVCAMSGIDIDTAINLKLDYNQTRPFKHGRAF